MSEQQPLMDDGRRPRKNKKSWREKTAEQLGAKWFRMTIIGLISLDSIIVLLDLSYSFLSDSCAPERSETPLWLEILTDISLAITILFVVELLLCAWTFGPSYYSPFRSILHFCDGSVIILTFVVDVLLRGRELELASLLILLRLLRFAAEAAVGVGELNEDTSKKLEEMEEELDARTKSLQAAQQEIEVLKRRLAGSSDGE